VLEGTLCMEAGGRVAHAQGASAVFVPRATPHTYWNPGPAPTTVSLGNDGQHLTG
jgi:hypothetical protein